MSSGNPTVLARREARRRKILENSENRLRSITGEGCHIKSISGSGLVEGSECSTQYEDLFTGKVQMEEENILYISPSSLKLKGKTYLENSNCGHLQKITGSEEVSENNDVPSTNCFATNGKSQILYLVVAIVLRVLIEINDSYVFVNSLVGAFILTKVGVTSVYGWQIPETSRLIGSVLLISGISSKKTNLFVFATSIVFNCVKDFAVLIFGFVFTELFINYLRHLL